MSRSTDRGRSPLVAATLAGAILVAAGCGENEIPAEDAAVIADSGAPARHLGYFYAGEYVEYESCDGEAMDIDGPVIAELVAMHADLTPGEEPLEQVFVDLWGEIERSDGDPRFDAIELRRVAYEGGGCETDDRTVFFRGSGSEPDWSLAIGEGGMTWSTPEGTEQMAHGGLYDGPRGEWLFDGLDEQDAAVLTATITQEPCVNPMSGSWSHLSMRVERGDRSFEGCAYLSPDAEEQG